jgi:hypothetical protein
MSEDQAISALADRLLAARGLTELDATSYADFREDLVRRIETAVDQALLDALPEEKLEEISKLAEVPGSDPSLITALLNTSVTNRPAIVQQVLDQFGRLYMETMGAQNV